MNAKTSHHRRAGSNGKRECKRCRSSSEIYEEPSSADSSREQHVRLEVAAEPSA